MADFVDSRHLIWTKRPSTRFAGEDKISESGWYSVNVPRVGGCLEPVDWVGNVDSGLVDKEITGFQFVDADVRFGSRLVGGNNDVIRPAA